MSYNVPGYAMFASGIICPKGDRSQIWVKKIAIPLKIQILSLFSEPHIPCYVMCTGDSFTLFSAHLLQRTEFASVNS